MTVLIKAATVAAMLNALPSSEGQIWVKLHTGNPGVAGTENVAAESTPKRFSFPAITEGEAAVGRKNTTAAEWPEVKAAETYKFVSFWVAELGSFFGYGELTEAKAVEIGNLFKFPIGSIVFHF